MPLFYFDTSALLKRYKPEEGTEIIDDIFSFLDSSKSRMITSLFTIVEVTSASERLVKTGDLSEPSFYKILEAFVDDAGKYIDFLSMDNDMVLSAAEAVRGYSLRPGDAIQYTSLNRIKKLTNVHETEVVFVVADIFLCQTASSQRIKVLNPTTISKNELLKYIES